MNRRERTRQKKRKERERSIRQQKHRRRLLPPTDTPVEREGEEFLDLHPGEDLPSPSSFVSERALRRIARLMESRTFHSEAEMPAFLESQAGQRVDEIGGDVLPHDGREQAQELAFQAIESRDADEIERLADEALRLDPNCIDALGVLAIARGRDDAGRIAGLERAVEAGARSLGGDRFFAENRGRFWDMVFTRPYMRTRQALADMLVEAERGNEALDHYEALLALDERDGQGNRYQLLGIALERGDLERCRRLFGQFRGDPSACFAWGRVLERFLTGDRRGAAHALRVARQTNGHVERAFIDGEVREPLVNAYAAGSPEEAGVVIACIGRAWIHHRGAFEWVANGGAASTDAERRRAKDSYSGAVAGLLKMREPKLGNWIDYSSKMGLGPAEVPELLRMLSDLALHELPGDDRGVWGPLHAWRALGQMRRLEAVEPLVALLRERADDDWTFDELPQVLAMIGPASLPALTPLVADHDATDDARMGACEAIRRLVTDDPSTRGEVAAALVHELAQFEANSIGVNTAIVWALMDAKATEAKALIRLVFDANRLDPDFVEGWEEIEEVICGRPWPPNSQ